MPRRPIKRRPVLQVFLAFLTGFFGRLFRLGRPAELVAAPLVRDLLRPRGVVSPEAMWHVFPTPEPVVVINRYLQEGNTPGEQVRYGRPGTLVRSLTASEAEDQQGFNVMELKRGPLYHTVMGAMPPGPPPTYVTPTSPVAPAGGAWQPLQEFVPLKPHPELPPVGTLLGTVLNPARAVPVDITDDSALKEVVGRWHHLPPEEMSPEVRAKIEANYAELFANWDEDTADPLRRFS